MNFGLRFKMNTLTLKKRHWLTRKRERLLVVEEEMQGALSNVLLYIERICAKNQAQILH